MEQPSTFYDELVESVMFDRDEPVDSDAVKLAGEDFITAENIKKRGAFVKSKGWFSLHAALRSVIKDWTILRLAIGCMEAHLLDAGAKV